MVRETSRLSHVRAGLWAVFPFVDLISEVFYQEWLSWITGYYWQLLSQDSLLANWNNSDASAARPTPPREEPLNL